MYQDSKRTCTAIVLLIKPFYDVFPVAVAIVVCQNYLLFGERLDKLFTSSDSKMSGFTRPHVFAPNGGYCLYITVCTFADGFI